MRSRYTAYCLRNSEYLLATWDAANRPKSIDFSRENVIWLRLEISETKKGGVGDSKGVVSFKAFYSQDGDEFVMRETSRFVKNGSHWFYVDGVGAISKAGVVNEQSKNGACHCGSGKKFKRCCGAG
jgi:SEC-C motif-containing protein